MILIAGLAAAPAAKADFGSAARLLRQARTLYANGQYFRSARYAFAADQESSSVKPQAYAWITLSLARAGLYNSASYFFIRTLQMNNKAAIREVLPDTPEFLMRLGPDLIRKYLIEHTTYSEYDPAARSAYLYALAKDALLSGDSARAVGYLNAVQHSSRLWPYALEMRGSAEAILNRNQAAIADFRQCEDKADDLTDGVDSGTRYYHQVVRESQDLRARCYAGEARTLYQMDRFEDADRTYDKIPKASLVWPEILFEQAWNAYALGQYNRTLGKLVSYKSPALSFVFNTEIDVLRAQAYLALCLYQDANQVINQFNSKYASTGIEVKRFVESHQNNLPAFYELGKRALQASLYTSDGMYKMANQFVRGPYFQNLVASEEQTYRERQAIARFAANEPERGGRGGGFPGFLARVLDWRVRTIRLLGGMFVKNSFLDYHASLISDFDKMAFIKVEMLKRAKDQLMNEPEVSTSSGRTRGNVIPKRRDYQMYWSFNGEFWNDELGDYVFGLKSQCKGDAGAQ